MKSIGLNTFLPQAFRGLKSVEAPTLAVSARFMCYYCILMTENCLYITLAIHSSGQRWPISLFSHAKKYSISRKRRAKQDSTAA